MRRERKEGRGGEQVMVGWDAGFQVRLKNKIK
jgi:hypothetical protein